MLQNEAKGPSEGDIELVAGNFKNDIGMIGYIENTDEINPGNINRQEVLNRIEAKIDVIAQSDVSEFVELFLTQLRKNVEDIRDYLNSKVVNVFEEMETVKEEVGKIKEYLAKSEGLGAGYYTDEPLDTEELNNLARKLSAFDSFEDNVECVLNEVRFLSDRFSENLEGLAKNLSESISFKDVIDPILEQVGKIKEELKEFTEFTESGKDLFDKISGQIVILRDVSKKADVSNDGIFELKNIVADINQTLSKAEFFQDDLNGFNTYVEGITDNFRDLNTQFQDLILKFKELRSDVSDINLNTNKVSVRFEDDSKLLRDSLADFEDKFKEFFEINTQNQNTNIDKFTHLNLDINNAAKNTFRKIDNVSRSLDKIDADNSGISKSIDTVKKTIIELVQWIDNAKAVLEEDHSKIIEIAEKTGNQEILSEIEVIKQATTILMSRYEDLKNLQGKQDEILNFLQKNSITVSNSFNSVNEKLEESVKQILDSKVLQNHEKKIENLLVSLKSKLEEDMNEILNSNAFRNQEIKIDAILDAIRNFYQQEEGIYSILKGYNSQFGIQFDNIGQSLRNITDRVQIISESRGNENIEEIISDEIQNQSKQISSVSDDIKNLNKKVSHFEKDINETLTELSQNLAYVAENGSTGIDEKVSDTALIEIKRDFELEFYKINRKIDNFEIYLSKIDEKLDKIICSSVTLWLGQRIAAHH